MVLEKEQVISLIKNGVSEHIQDCREYSKILNMHVTGKGIKEYTEDFNEHESIKQRKLREKLLKSNKATFSFLLRPIDKIFTAKGGSVNYNTNEPQIETIKDYISNVSEGLDLKTFLKKKAKLNYVIDPNAFTMVDVNPKGGLEAKIYRTEDVIWYERNGNNIEAIIFNAFESEDKEDDKNYYRVIDDLTDSIYVEDGENIYLQEGSVLDNFFGYVPAFILGDIHCPNSEKFLSVIDDVLDDANEHLRDVSVNIVHKLSHGYAKYWQYPEDCTTCNGDGELEYKEADDTITRKTCHTCHGLGVKDHKNASDVMLMDIPQEGEPVINTPGGYINPSIEVWKQYKQDILDLRNGMFQTMWGSTFSVDAKNETATGKLINVQPEAERVSGISTTFSKIHEFLLDTYGRVALFTKEYKSNVSYGTRYLMESPDEVLDRYTKSKKEGLPALLQQDLLDRFYQAEYANNNEEYLKTKKILSVDPFPSMSANEVKLLGVPEEELLKKIYYPQWVNQLTDAKKILMSPDELKSDLQGYINNLKLKIDVSKEVQEGADQPK